VPPDVKRELFESRLRVEIDVVGPGLVHLLEDGVRPIYIGRVVLVVVQPQQVFRNNRCQRVVFVCKLRQTLQFGCVHYLISFFGFMLVKAFNCKQLRAAIIRK